VFLQLGSVGYLEINEPFSTLKILICRKYSFQKLSKFSEVNNVIDSAAFYTHGFLLRDMRDSSTQVYRPTWNKERLSVPWKTHLA
jgi:hypothetical protein